MKEIFLFLFLIPAAMALDNFVSGPTATLVYTDKKRCEAQEGKACYLKPEDHSITKIEGGKLVEDAAKKAAKEQAETTRLNEGQLKKTSCDAARTEMLNVKKDGEAQAAFDFIKNCLL